MIYDFVYDFITYDFHTTSLVPSPISFQFQLSYPSAYAVPGPAR